MRFYRLQTLVTTILASVVAPAATGAETMTLCETEADTLDDRTLDLEEVVITGLRIPRLLKDTPVQTRLITAEDIRKADATDIRDLLQTEMPGVEFSYAMNQQVHLNFNGQGGQSVLFLVDGERLAGETMDDVDFSRLNMSDVERIEIVRGASSALYGSNAGGGVINIITRKASSPWRVSGDARYSRHNEQRYNLGLTLKAGRFSNILSGNRHYMDNYDVHSAPDPQTRVFSTVYGSSVWSVSDRLVYTPVDRLRLTARAGYFFRQLTRNEDSPERYRDYSAGLRADWRVSDIDKVELSYAFDQYDKSELYRASDLDVRNYSNVQNSVRSLYSHTFSDGSSLTAGADFMREFMMNVKMADRRHHQITADAFAQYDWIISPDWEVVGALRYDYFSDNRDSRVTPKISVRYSPVAGMSLRLGYGMGFRAPTLKEKYYNFDMAGIWIVNGNPELKPETSHNVTFSTDYTRGAFNYTVSVYYNNIRDRISTGLPYTLPGDDSQLYLDYVNLSRYSVVGGEATVQARWMNGLSARLSYALTHEFKVRDKDGHSANNQYIPARQHSLTFRGDWHHAFSRRYELTVSLSGRFLSSVDNEEYRDYYDISKGTVTVHYPAYTLWKVSLTQKIGRFISVNLAVDNIFNYKPKYYYLNCPLTDGANFMAGVSFDFY